MYGVAFTSFVDPSIALPLHKTDGQNGAVEVMIEEDGWPGDMWPITNDSEKYLHAVVKTFPYLILVNLETMEIHKSSPADIENADELIEMIENF
ncbi:MAG: hypothetical protein QNJ97_17530 [Myxococcota bacterium]|nr:hypothetical protein [Myxococcota bacterium]